MRSNGNAGFRIVFKLSHLFSKWNSYLCLQLHLFFFFFSYSRLLLIPLMHIFCFSLSPLCVLSCYLSSLLSSVFLPSFLSFFPRLPYSPLPSLFLLILFSSSLPSSFPPSLSPFLRSNQIIGESTFDIYDWLMLVYHRQEQPVYPFKEIKDVRTLFCSIVLCSPVQCSAV